MTYCVSPEVFFLVEGDKLLVWHTKTHQQFLLDKTYINTLLSLKSTSNSEALNNMLQAGIVIQKSDCNDWGWDILARLFHRGTQDVPSDDSAQTPQAIAEQYLSRCGHIAKTAPQWFRSRGHPHTDLPAPALNHFDMPYADIMQSRLTCRQFNGHPITLQQLSDLLFASFGLIHGEWQLDDSSGIAVAGVRKATPSSGGLHAEEAYIVIYNVDGLAPGLYYYQPQDHRLGLLESGDFESHVIDWNRQQYFSQGLAAGIYLTARFDKYWWKYPHSRSYRVMLMDMGHVSQHCLMCATALGLQTWQTGAFEDSAIEQFLQINSENEGVMLFLGVGHGKASGIPSNFSNAS